jgi:AcrR family transcriptional regulator
MARSKSTAAAASIDGRAMRSERSREAIVAAMLELVGAGVLAPTAEQIAERAGVGLRTVFRHFGDLESIFAAMDAQLGARVARELGAEQPVGPVARRIADLVRRRTRLFELIAPYKRAETLKRWQSPFLQARNTALVRRLRAETRRWLPELEAAGDDVGHAVDLALSFEAWDRLRRDQRLAAPRALAVLELSVAALLARR